MILYASRLAVLPPVVRRDFGPRSPGRKLADNRRRYDEIIEAMVQFAGFMPVGMPDDPGAQRGPSSSASMPVNLSSSAHFMLQRGFGKPGITRDTRCPGARS